MEESIFKGTKRFDNEGKHESRRRIWENTEEFLSELEELEEESDEDIMNILYEHEDTKEYEKKLLANSWKEESCEYCRAIENVWRDYRTDSNLGTPMTLQEIQKFHKKFSRSSGVQELADCFSQLGYQEDKPSSIVLGECMASFLTPKEKELHDIHLNVLRMLYDFKKDLVKESENLDEMMKEKNKVKKSGKKRREMCLNCADHCQGYLEDLI